MWENAENMDSAFGILIDAKAFERYITDFHSTRLKYAEAAKTCQEYSKWAVVYALLQYVQNTASSNKTSNHFPANCKFYWANNNNDIQLKCTHNVDVPRCANWLRFMHTSTASILFHSDPLIFGIVHRNPQRNINILQIFVSNVNKCCMLSIAYFSNAIDTLYEFYLPFSYDCPCRTARAFKQNIVYTLQSSGRLAIISLCLLDAQRIISGSCMKVKILSKKSPHYIHSNGAQRNDVWNYPFERSNKTKFTHSDSKFTRAWDFSTLCRGKKARSNK